MPTMKKRLPELRRLRFALEQHGGGWRGVIYEGERARHRTSKTRSLDGAHASLLTHYRTLNGGQNPPPFILSRLDAARREAEQRAKRDAAHAAHVPHDANDTRPAAPAQPAQPAQSAPPPTSSSVPSPSAQANTQTDAQPGSQSGASAATTTPDTPDPWAALWTAVANEPASAVQVVTVPVAPQSADDGALDKTPQKS